jgi:ring-1,2-phenylacetyl-CoA epoxidase subunit PaaE
MTGATATRRRPRTTFHPLTVAAVDELTEDAVAVAFAVPADLRDVFTFKPGQHLTVRMHAAPQGAPPPPSPAPARTPARADTEIRRSYSICSTPADLSDRGLIRIGVREIAGGAFSAYARRALRVGDTVEVLPPLGHFTTPLEATRTRHYAAIAAGSGITPVLSLMATALATEPGSRFTLLFGNRRAASVMFAEEVADLKDRYPGRLHVVHVLSREPQLSPLLSGRLDAQRLRAILDAGLVDAPSVDEWFLCGPYAMVMDARGVLAERGVADKAVHTELFHVEGEPVPPTPRRDADGADDTTTVTIVLDGRESTFGMRADERVLDAALRVRSELPYACKGGVCSTCRARLVEGEVDMVANYALEPEELAAGYVLTCQSRPRSERLVVDYDA